MFVFEKLKTQYSIKLTPEQFEHIDMLDGITIISGSLYTILEQIPGIDSVDYNGHFGSYIYLYIDKEHDNNQTWKAITHTIEIYLNRSIPYGSYPNRHK